jgi:hypothetical protein
MNVGRYKQGDIITHPEDQPLEAGTPAKAPLAGPAPKGEQHQKAPMKTVGANRIAAH